MYTEVNTQTNLPAQIDICAVLVMSTISSVLIKEAALPIKRALSGNQILIATRKTDRIFNEKMKSLGTAACPPYHIAFVVEGFQPIKP